MADARIRAVITADDRASATLGRFSNSVNSLGNKIKTTMKVAAAAAAAAIGAGIVANLNDAIKRLDTLSNSARAFENMGFSAKEAGRAMSALDQSIRGLPTPLDSAVRGMTLLAASTNDIGRSQKVFTALNNAILGFGGSAAQVDNAVIQLSQDLAGGRITAQTWLSFLNSGLGPALNAMARQMKLTTRELKEGLSDGSISVETFQKSLIELNTKGGGGMKSFEKIAKDSTNGIANSWQNMNTAIARGIANLLKAIGRDRIAGVIQGAGTLFENFFKSLIAFGRGASEIAEKLRQALTPSLNELRNIIATKLIPPIKDLIDTLEPGLSNTLKVIAGAVGVAVVVALKVFISVLGVAATILGKVVEAINSAVKWISQFGGVLTDVRQKISDVASGVRNAITNMVDDAVVKLEEMRAAWDRNFNTIKNFGIFLGLLFGPLLIKMTVLAVASAIRVGVAWSVAAAKSGSAWLVNFAIMSAQAVAHAVVATAQAAVSGAVWLANAAKAGVAWAIQFAIMSAGAIATGAVMVAAAIKAGIAWLVALGPVSLAIGVVAAAAFLIIKNWSKVTGFFRGMWEGIKNIFKAGVNYIIDKLNAPIRAFNKISDKLPGDAGQIAEIPTFAKGVRNFSGGMAVVGEQGPELVNLPSGSDVIPNNSLGSTINLTVNVGVYAGTELEKRKLAETLLQSMRDIASSKNQSFGIM